MRLVADPLADDTVARIAGRWSTDDVALSDLVVANASRWERIASANRAIASWTCNGGLQDWTPCDASLDRDIAGALTEYLHAGSTLPDWADRAKIERAEALFFDYGPLSCILLFCASLPECYVIPDLADVLHATGQLEQRTDYRVRSTAAMIFPVMMRGGLTRPDGGGIAQILKVRLIHAMVRNLILRGRPADAADHIAPLPDGSNGHANPQAPASACARAQAPASHAARMHHALFALGWSVPARGLPCNQEELAYTLLTFNYVFLRSLRQLGLGLSAADETAYLHCWNVAGHILGIRRELMAETMSEAEALFEVMQSRGRAQRPEPDVRPRLGQALVDTLSAAIRLPIVRHFPALMTYHLCGPESSRDVGVTGQAPWTSRALFAVVIGGSRVIDGVMRLFSPEFAISRLLTRVLGYHVMSSLLLDATRPLKLPDHLAHQIDVHMACWRNDPKAPRWVNALEAVLTVAGPWRHRGSTSQPAASRP